MEDGKLSGPLANYQLIKADAVKKENLCRRVCRFCCCCCEIEPEEKRNVPLIVISSPLSVKSANKKSPDYETFAQDDHLTDSETSKST